MMESNWSSLFILDHPRVDRLPKHDDRLLLDMGLIRTENGRLALAQDPTHEVMPPSSNTWNWIRSLFGAIKAEIKRLILLELRASKLNR